MYVLVFCFVSQSILFYKSLMWKLKPTSAIHHGQQKTTLRDMLPRLASRDWHCWLWGVEVVMVMTMVIN